MLDDAIKAQCCLKIPYTDIGEALGIPDGTLRCALRRLRRNCELPFREYKVTQRTKDKISKKLKGQTPKMIGKNNPMYGKVPYSRRKWSAYLGHYFRSKWELDVCTFLKDSKIPYMYEAIRFDAPTYTWHPDVKFNDKLYLEVKGYMPKETCLKIAEIMRANLDTTWVFLAGPKAVAMLSSQRCTNVICIPYDKEKKWQDKLLHALVPREPKV
jgi:hypothetical protein